MHLTTKQFNTAKQFALDMFRARDDNDQLARIMEKVETELRNDGKTEDYIRSSLSMLRTIVNNCIATDSDPNSRDTYTTVESLVDLECEKFIMSNNIEVLAEPAMERQQATAATPVVAEMPKPVPVTTPAPETIPTPAEPVNTWQAYVVKIREKAKNIKHEEFKNSLILLANQIESDTIQKRTSPELALDIAKQTFDWIDKPLTAASIKSYQEKCNARSGWKKYGHLLIVIVNLASLALTMAGMIVLGAAAPATPAALPMIAAGFGLKVFAANSLQTFFNTDINSRKTQMNAAHYAGESIKPTN